MKSEKKKDIKTGKIYDKAYDSIVNQGDLERAIAEYHKVISYNPGCAQAYYDLGYISNMLGKRKEVIIYFENYLRLSPEAHDREEIENLINSLKTMVNDHNIKVRYFRKAINI